MEYQRRNGYVLVLRTCAVDMTSHGGFVWPESGFVEAPDWEPTRRCGYGLHGLLWGEGDGLLLSWKDDAKWLVCEVPEDQIVDLEGKVKFPKAEVIYCGDRNTATDLIYRVRPGAVAGVIATVGNGEIVKVGYRGIAIAGDYGKAIAGYVGTATSGHLGTATVGNYGTATAGVGGTATAGEYGTATAGDFGTATAGVGGTAFAGYRGTATAGDYGTATAGDFGTATAGYRGIIQINAYLNGRRRIIVGYIGEDRLLPNTTYKLDAEGKFVKAE